MAENPTAPSLPPLRKIVERKKRSCSECRRRKQKCDQRRPCRHCSRRNPQPPCIYEDRPHSPRPPVLLPVPPFGPFDRIPSPVPDPSLFQPIIPSPVPPSVSPPLIPSPVNPWDGASPSGSGSGNSSHDSYPDFPPGSTGSPVVHPSMFTEICLLSSEAVTDREAVLAARWQAVSALYKQFNRPESSTSNDTMASVVKLVINDLCFGETQETKVHFDGLREMTRARGGLQFLGRDGVLAKTIIIVDRVTAIALEASPNYPQEDVSAFAESLTPVPASVPTSTQSYLEEPTSAILRDMTFLIDSVVALPRDPSPWQMEKVISVSEWVHNRLFGVAEGSSTAASPLHTSIRLASLMYCEAIQSRRPFSTTVNEQQILDLVGAVWEVPLETWNDMLATLLWTLIPLLPTARTMPQCYSTKMMMMAAAVQLSMNDFETAAKTLDTAVKLQEWLRTSQE